MAVGLDDLTVAITTYRRPSALAKTLATLAEAPKVSVVLNGSSMVEYRNVIEEYSDQVRFAQNIRNLGVAATANRSIMESDTRYLVWATDSCNFSPEWWRPVISLLNSDTPHKQISMSSPKRFTAVCIDKEVIAAQGFYDHNYTQVYYEDEDMYLRSLERLGLHDQEVDLSDSMAVISVVESRLSSKVSWNSVPNRSYFWRKWERVDTATPGYLKLRDGIRVRRRLPEPDFPYLALVQERYRRGDYSAIPFVYDPPSPRQVRLTKLTTNPVVTRSRHLISRLTNREGKLK